MVETTTKTEETITMMSTARRETVCLTVENTSETAEVAEAVASAMCVVAIMRGSATFKRVDGVGIVLAWTWTVVVVGCILSDV